MDKGTLHSIALVLMTLAFLGVCWWAFSPSRKKRFEEDAKLPFADDEELGKSAQERGGEEAGAGKGQEKKGQDEL
ncbi:cbb3-type cytochrome oxidase subunit 3 [Biformimicrobium ophioploci]|uniref:Uncharacterized protein n=1 Tax=Biformimicrobium ophioploci TaxID=3036711 RepID=A0ABQ6LXQ3_9GAMM|nr:cbb3-type cytochrome c oxidase subunit 3 [Microbulbifer sp. NKW57]GMG86802.1 hypothetical protein MNKW57_11230 [Microbulbifer sp. NKW57]